MDKTAHNREVNAPFKKERIYCKNYIVSVTNSINISELVTCSG